MRDLDSKQSLKNHYKIIRQNSLLYHWYEDFYKIISQIKHPNGICLELGSGAGFLKKIIPHVITSDVIAGKGIDKVVSAEKLPFRNNSISCIYMLNVFHHIKDPEAALRQMQMKLKKGGKIVMIETYNTPWASFIYTNFHHEPFIPTAMWKTKGKGRMSDSNQALPWIVFVRDRKTFYRKFRHLKIVAVTPHTPLRYLLSGGLSHSPLIPSYLEAFTINIENLLTPLNRYIGMFATIIIEKT